MPNVELLHVYVIEDENHIVKIGIAGNVGKRISSIDTSSGYEIINQYESPSCANARKIEKAAHKHFTNHRKKGEWFIVPFDDAVSFVKDHFVSTTQQLALPVGPAELDREFNGIRIRQRTSDNYLDATAMCQATSKIFRDYQRNQATQEFLAVLSRTLGTPIESQMEISPFGDFKGLVEITKGGSYAGTWVHPRVSINLAQWCSPEFAVIVTEWVFELMTKGHVSLNGQPALTPEIETFITARVHDAIANALTKPATSNAEMDCVQDDTWKEAISVFLDTLDKVHTYQLLNVIGLNSAKISRSDTIRIKKIMRRLGWQKCVPTIEGKRLRGYLRPWSPKL